MRSYAVITNVSIDENRFLNLEIMNNIDLARWAEKTPMKPSGDMFPIQTVMCCQRKNTRRLKEKYPDEITTDCDKWQSRRTVDNYNLLAVISVVRLGKPDNFSGGLQRNCAGTVSICDCQRVILILCLKRLERR